LFRLTVIHKVTLNVVLKSRQVSIEWLTAHRAGVCLASACSLWFPSRTLTVSHGADERCWGKRLVGLVAPNVWPIEVLTRQKHARSLVRSLFPSFPSSSFIFLTSSYCFPPFQTRHSLLHNDSPLSGSRQSPGTVLGSQYGHCTRPANVQNAWRRWIQ
jgi:hypothetical protein